MDEYHGRQQLSATGIACKNYCQCMVGCAPHEFAAAREASVRTGYGNGNLPRLLFSSLDSAGDWPGPKVLPAFRLYDLRHTYASRAVMAGVDLPTLAALLGHTSVQMPMRYVHLFEGHKREAAGKIRKFKQVSAMRLAERSQRITTIFTALSRVS